MLQVMRVLIGFAIAVNLGCAGTSRNQETAQDCTDEWFQIVENQISSGDGQGHGPDIGSLEWRQVVEFKLGIRDDSSVPPVESQQWCNYINEHFIKHAT